MAADDAQAPKLDDFRDYLIVLARTKIPFDMRGQLDASDIVQETLLEAHTKRHQFQGTEAASLAAWLRKMLSFNLIDKYRSLRRQKRDVGKDVSIEGSLEESSIRFDAWLASNQSSPSLQLRRQELALSLASKLEKLPEFQRDAVRMRYIQGMTIADISECMEKSPTAVAGLLKRGLEGLREIIGPHLV
jgi:RNA polymerase sigma-70 factor (ECF subfamily)